MSEVTLPKLELLEELAEFGGLMTVAFFEAVVPAPVIDNLAAAIEFDVCLRAIGHGVRGEGEGYKNFGWKERCLIESRLSQKVARLL